MRTYTAVLALALLVTAAFYVRAASPGRRGAAADACLLALALGLIGARAQHVLLHWDYFGAHVAEAFDLGAGGLGWHGGAAGGLIGLWIGGRLRRPFSTFAQGLRPLALAVPLIMLAGWYGCWAAGCAYGVEVATLADYPAWAAAELRDIYGLILPRLHTPLFGMTWAVLTFVFVATAARRWPGRFWIALALTALGMFAIGSARADAIGRIAGLRADQVLDLLVMAIGLWRARPLDTSAHPLYPSEGS
jgi:prolipoprotein diacylglyceryltransferase